MYGLCMHAATADIHNIDMLYTLYTVYYTIVYQVVPLPLCAVA
jgi:hypothetical protein